jgi:hypothetical protein
MGAPTGNQFWILRSKHGRDKIFTDPETFREACYEYFETTSNRKWLKHDFVGKDAEEVFRESEVPFTKSGLAVFLGVDWETIKNYKKEKDFFGVITHIEEIIYTQKIEGASVGAFNASIVARELQLKESTDVTTNGDNIQTIQVGYTKKDDQD